MASPLKTGDHTTFGRVDAMPSFGDAMTASLKMSAEDTPTANLLDLLEFSELKKGTKVPMDTLNEKYDLDLREDTTEEYAQTVFETRQRTAKLQRIVEDGTRNSPTLGLVGSFGLGMLPEIIDPINLGASLLIGPSASFLYGGALKARNASKVARSLARKGSFFRKSPMANKVTEGIAGNLVADIFVVYGNEIRKSDASMSQILGMSVATGAIFPIIGGLFKKMFKKIGDRSGVADDVEMDHSKTLSEYREDVSNLSDDIAIEFDSGTTILKYNEHLDNIDRQILEIENFKPETEGGKLDQRKEIQGHRETRKFILDARDEIIEANKGTDKGVDLKQNLKQAERRLLVENKVKEKVKEIDVQVNKISKRMSELEEIIYTPIGEKSEVGRNKFNKRKRLINEYQSLEQQRNSLEGARNLLDTSLNASNRQAELDEIDSLLFNNKDFDFISLDSNNIGKLVEYYKSSIDNGVRPDMEMALNSIKRKHILPRIEKEIKAIEGRIKKVNELDPDGVKAKKVLASERGRLEYLTRKSAEIKRLPVDSEEVVKTAEKIWTKFDPDEKYKGVEADEMEAQVFNERVSDPEVKTQISEARQVAEMGVNCRLQELNGE